MIQSDAVIEKGRKLNRLLGLGDYQPLKEQWDERIKDLEEARDGWRTASGQDQLLEITHELRALKSLRDWITDEIEAGGKLLKLSHNRIDQEPANL